MSRQCERPGCAEPAAVSYGFDARQRMAWLGPLGEGGGGLCRRHAERFVVPRGWWLSDRRDETTLFRTTAAAEAAMPAKPRKRRARAEPKPPVTLPLDREAAPPAEERWTTRVVAMGDLDGLLDARTPLLARAFKRPDTDDAPPSPAAGDAAS